MKCSCSCVTKQNGGHFTKIGQTLDNTRIIKGGGSVSMIKVHDHFTFILHNDDI